MGFRETLGKAAESQLAGPFGKLGRYVLKRQGGIVVPPRGESAELDPDEPAGARDAPKGQVNRGTRKGGESLLQKLARFLGR